MDSEHLVKENRLMVLPLSWRWVCAGLALSACAMIAVARIDYALPEPLTRDNARPDQFIAELAHEHLVNLTSIGPRVAGSYENEVVSVAVLVSAVKSIAAQASPHNRVELDVHRASGGFALTFMDGMNNVYRDVQSVVARVSGAGAKERPRTAILLNCHFDTVPDSPGASDDGAGCAVLLETLRALASTPRPLRHDAVFLFNGAEENILQASHAFITQHKWAKSVRAFINIEACGAGGREVLFQAGPHDPWIIEVYAGVVPHPFASSLAQELFESGLIPADTDFRIFRDFGKLSGVDLAWSANGYVYHTRLDTAQNVPPEALQRTGDNVLALAHGLLSSSEVESEVDALSRQPVFFDVLGWYVVSARAPAAAALCVATLLLVLLKLRLSSAAAARELYLPTKAWWGAVIRAMGTAVLAGVNGVLAAVAVALVLHTLGARLTFYSQPLLLVPLYIMPGVAACWATARALWARWRGRVPARGWWGARAAHDAHAALAGAALLLCALRGLRSGFLPLLWALLPPLADVLATLLRAPPRTRAACWATGAALPLLQTCYLLLNSLHILVPTMGRAGAGAMPPDVVMAIIATTLVLSALSWMLPFVMATRNLGKLMLCMAAVCVATMVLVVTTPLGAAYSDEQPQRLMLFHTRRTVHALAPGHVAHVAHAAAAPEHFYWVPELDANTLFALDNYVTGATRAREVTAAECDRWVYCGVPYFLPVLTLVGRSYVIGTEQAPRPRIAADLSTKQLDEHTRALYVNVTEAPQHVVLIVAPVAGATVVWSNVVSEPLEGAAWGARRTYFVALHAARAPARWALELRVRGAGAAAGPLADVALAGHAMFGPDKYHEEHERTLAALPTTVAATGWGVDLHLYSL